MKKSRRRTTHKAKRVIRRYPGKLPKHVKRYTVTVKGKKRVAYFSKITNRRISAKKIRSNRKEQFFVEVLSKKFQKISDHGIRNIKGAVSSYNRHYKDMGRAERHVIEDQYKELFKYLRANAPDLLPEYQELTEGITDENDQDDVENSESNE